MDRHRGYTLPELVFTMAIAVGLLGWGVPTFRDLQRNAARTREVNQFIQAVYLARSEAIKRNRVVSLCPSVDAEDCAPAGTSWQAGWIVFVNGLPSVRADGRDRNVHLLRRPGLAGRAGGDHQPDGSAARF